MDKFNVTIFIQFRTFFVGLGSCNRLARDMFAAYLNDLLELSQLFILLPHFGLHLHLFVFNPFGLCNKTFQSVSKGCYGSSAFHRVEKLNKINKTKVSP